MSKKVLGLDVGISSLGWAIIEYSDDKNEEAKILDFGTRIWEVPEEPKTKETLTSKRREFRSKRRNIHRKQFRIKTLKKLFFNSGLVNEEQYNEHLKNIKDGIYNSSNNLDYNPLYLRYKGLTEELSNLQILLALVNIAKRRGYNNMFEFEADKESRESISKGEELIKKYKYPIIAFYEEFGNGFEDPKPFMFRNNSASNSSSTKIIELLEDVIKTSENDSFAFDDVISFLSREDIKYSFVIPSKLQETIEKILKKQKIAISKEQKEKLSELIKVKVDKQSQNKKETDFVIFKHASYKKEVEDFLQIQTKYKNEFADLSEKIIEIIFSQRPFEDGPGPLNHDQRKKFEESAKQYYKGFEHSIGRCTFYPEERRTSNFSIVSDLYIILKNVENSFPFSSEENFESELQILSKINRDVINEYFKKRKISTSSVSQIFSNHDQEFKKKSGISFENANMFLFNLNKSNSKLVDSLLTNIDSYPFKLEENQQNKLEVLGEILYLNKTKELIVKKLQNLDNEYFSDPEKWFIDNQKHFKNKTYSFSKKFALDAINNVLDAKLTISKFEAKINAENEEKIMKKMQKLIAKNKIKPFSPIRDRDMERNKVVFRSINETRKVVKALFNKYNDFEDIIVEVASELYSEKSVRNKIEKTNENNLKYNKEVESKIIEYGEKPSRVNIDKYKLWDSQRKGKEAYAFDPYNIDLKKEIKLEDIFTEDYQIDHIIPYSKYNNNSLTNKVLTSTINNQSKGDRTPLQFLKDSYNSKQISSWEKQITKHFKGKNVKKLEFLLLNDLNDDSISGFVSSDINDTRYISKYISKYIEQNWNQWNIKKGFVDNKKVSVVQGRVTSRFRRMWLRDGKNLKNSAWSYDKPRDFTPFHHAVDAIIVALMQDDNQINFYKNLMRPIEYYNELATKSKSITRNELIKELEKLETIIFDEYNKNYKYIPSNKKEFYLKEISQLIDDLILKTQTESGKIYPISFVEFNSYKEWLNPKINNLPEKVTNLIPVRLKLEEKKKDDNPENSKRKTYDVEFDDLVTRNEWTELNKDKEISQFPYVSYKSKNRIRGNLMGSENMISKKDALDDDGAIKKAHMKDSKGNYWKANEYYGFESSSDNKLHPLTRMDLVKLKRHEYNLNPIITKNTVFISDNNIYRYMAMKNINQNKFNIAHPNLYSPSQPHHDANFKSEKRKSSITNFTKIEYKPITIDILGKVASKNNGDFD